MRILSLSNAKAKLNELVDDAVRTHEHVTITRNGAPAAVLISAEEWDSITETRFWSAQPGIAETVQEGRDDYDSGATVDEAEVRARYNAPKR